MSDTCRFPFFHSAPIVLGALLLLPTAALAQSDAPTLTGIVIGGNARTDEQVVLRIMDLKLGQPMDMETMDAAWDALEDCGYFQFVDLEDEEDDTGGVTLRVNVEEDMFTYYGPVLKPHERHKYLVGAWLEERNLRGRGETLRLEATGLYVQTGRLSWQHPWLAGVRDLELRITVEAAQAPFVFRPTRTRKWDAGATVRWDFRRPFFVTAGVTYGHFRQRDDFDWAVPDRGPDGPIGTATHAAGGETHWRLDFAAGIDTRDNPNYPRRGAFLSGRVSRWDSDGFDGYTETSLDARSFTRLPGWTHVLALRAWGRRVDGPAQLDNILYLGGPPALRGYRYGSIEGDEGWLLTVEYRVPLFLMSISPQGDMVGFGVHLFGDAGDAWYEGDDPHRPAQSVGAGIHMVLDSLQLRIEEARTRDGDWRFVFMNGFVF